MIDDASFWQKIRERFEELSQTIASGNLDSSRRQKIQKEHSFLSELLKNYDELQKLKKEQLHLENQLQQQSDEDIQELYKEELVVLSARMKKAEQEIDEILYPPDELDTRSAFLEIRPGAGGQEAALFVGDLMRMYTNYALQRGWRVDQINLVPTDIGGFKEVVLEISGKGAFGALKYEAGVHRVQRVPATETSGRVHTSTATVAVLAEAKEVDVSINPADLRIDVYRSSGAGGQHVNTTDSAVRITHIPTGVVVSCQDERSQHKNKAKALKVLQSRLLASERERQQIEQSKLRKEMVGSGMRAEKVRTYNYPQNRVTDHQVDITLKKLDMVMAGELNEIIDALIEKERTDRRSKPFDLHLS